MTATPVPSPTADAEGWVGPLIIETADYEQLSMALDGDGFVHAAFVRNGRIHYLTNQGGTWARQRVTLPDGRDNEPSISLDSDGSVGIAFTRWAPEDPDYCKDVTECIVAPQGIFYVTNRAGSWSAAKALAGPASNSPSLELRDGAIHLAYAASGLCGDLCGAAGLRYKTNSAGSWTEVEIGLTFGPPDLEIGADGSAYVAYSNLEWDNNTNTGQFVVLFTHVDGTTAAVTTETVWDGEEQSFWVDRAVLALDASDNPHVVAELWVSDEGTAAFYLKREQAQWTEQPAPPTAMVRAAAVDAKGTLHLLACCVAYMNSMSWETHERQLAPSEPGHDTRGDIAIDRLGRPHMLFTVNGQDGTTLWYAVGPAN